MLMMVHSINSQKTINEQTKQNLNEACQLNYVEIKIEDRTFKALIDTGAVCSVIGREVVQQLNLDILPTNSLLLGVDCKNIPVMGEVLVDLSLNNNKSLHTFLVIDNCNGQVLLGIDLIKKLKIKMDFDDYTYQIGGEPFKYQYNNRMQQRQEHDGPLTENQLNNIAESIRLDKTKQINIIKKSGCVSECYCNYCEVFEDFSPFNELTSEQIAERVRGYAKLNNSSELKSMTRCKILRYYFNRYLTSGCGMNPVRFENLQKCSNELEICNMDKK